MIRTLFFFFIFTSCNMNPPLDMGRVSVDDPNLEHKNGAYYYKGNLFNGIISNPKTALHTITDQSFVKGKMHGPYTEWFKDKTLKTKKNFVSNREEGVQKGFHYNGNLSYTYKAVDGKIDGIYSEYYPNGNLQIEEEYKMDSIVRSKKINIDGFVEENYHIKNNRKYGLTTAAQCLTVSK